ncbi:styrene monooxygenase/indole monooxygenase family protein [Streptomyces abikoensis]|uniref:styrene monooxygenase/indole monooxygenase family protein n=1 Tax=Streptomyces abikoensis TaxID=97398 RepID=UPI0016757DDB|nr:styrene monooxygenase/indole monooxygenase family protein [Streptomyces abikoensis]GGP64775.1 alanine-phosphoribitol ligase [Streptomyces abikoensis]
MKHSTRSIAVVGAGQAGLQLALGLRRSGHHVTLVSNRTARQVLDGRVMSTQIMFADALETERRLGLDHWRGEAPAIEGLSFTVAPGAVKAIDFEARLAAPGQSVDQRVKVAAWLEEFTAAGGELRIAEAGVAELEELAASHDLVLVAAGKGEIAGIFERDAERSPFTAPQRVAAVSYVHGLRPRDSFVACSASLIPGVGEYFIVPALTKSGPCDCLFLNGVPGGPLDAFADVRSPEEHLDVTKKLLAEFLPWEAERAAAAVLTDPGGVLAGRLTPTVRKPVATLPSGRRVLGVADVLVVNDPLTGQGSNSAAKCADVYLREILAHGDEPFDAEWMTATFERFWEYARHVTRWTNGLLPPAPAHVVDLLDAAQRQPGLASRIAEGFNNPPGLDPWWHEPEAARREILPEPAVR